MNNKKLMAQTTLELTLSLMAIVILLAGMIQVFIWFGKSLVGREKAYLSDFKNKYKDTSEFYTPSTPDIVPEISE